MAKPKRIYLAGPEVFFPASEHHLIVAEKKRLLREHGFEGVDPLDTELTFSDGQPKPDRGHRIYKANRELMDSCDAIIANLTPFRVSSSGSGLAFCLSNNLAYARIMQTETITTKGQGRGKTQDLTPALYA